MVASSSDADVFVGERVEDPASSPFGLDDAVGAQQPQRMRDGGLVGVGPVREVADAGFVVIAELHEDAQPARVGEHVEEVGHDDDVLRLDVYGSMPVCGASCCRRVRAL